MSNLIVTVIAIGLAAILSLSTIFYGGNAFTRNSGQAKAALLITEAQQIAGAWKQWSSNNGDQIDFSNAQLTAWYTGSLTNNPLVPKYLSAIPLNSAINGSQARPYWYFVNWTTPTITSNLPTVRPPNALRASFAYTDEAYGVCQAFLRSLQGQTVSIVLASTPTRLPGDCVVTDVNANGTPDSGDAIEFFYKVF